MSEKVLILGSSGMAGHVIYTYLIENTNYEVIGTVNSNQFNPQNIALDVFNLDEVKHILNTYKPSIVINCIGMLIKGSKSNPDQTIFCNAFFPYFLRKHTDKIDAKLIHISTDCVFSGLDGGYSESSFKDANDLYGISKSLGEINDDINLTIRTSIIGPEIKEQGEGLFHWFMHQNNEVTGFKSSYWSGITTIELAKFIKWVIEHPITGVINLTNGVPISKYELLKQIKSTYNKDIQINTNTDYISNKSLVSNRKIDFQVPSYKSMVEEMKIFMDQHNQFYEY
ncbi:dTDP-4-dehydrorhamnose reductase family protein [Psychrobacter sanguinis]|uniref:dTDP-4-dehydrorhamnose reductase n=1 Tax=Psychrobacter sanguinis TaxID=861445 RepID=A0A844LY36_9GAMM|nr:SDR family oxidoreductase [Psychrobacter sanguinis]MUG31581.1 sugar nucleotide-binding protein [Psychrobacter sanguinis]